MSMTVLSTAYGDDGQAFCYNDPRKDLDPEELDEAYQAKTDLFYLDGSLWICDCLICSTDKHTHRVVRTMCAKDGFLLRFYCDEHWEAQNTLE